MKFVALLSGGKDSCYNILKCEKEGHELVCLANLCPPEGAGEEMNSFMYQSAAHGIIPQMAECFGVPLIRRAIIGRAMCQHLDYEVNTQDTDEVEDLYLLLAEIIAKYPEIKGVSCGAILSTYQRLRVENVCNRLKLTPLTYLWQMNRDQLLDELCHHQFEVILVKVAGAGLDPYKHLGKTLSHLKPQLYHLHNKLGLDVCGEGGEYESLVLDCPMFSRSGMRLRVLSSEVLLDDEDCSVGNYVITRSKVVPREGSGDDPTLTVDGDEWARVWALGQACSDLTSEHLPGKDRGSAGGDNDGSRNVVHVPALPLNGNTGDGEGCSFSWCAGGYGNTGLLLPPKSTRGLGVATQVHSLFSLIKGLLVDTCSSGGRSSDLGLDSFADITYVHLYLEDMASFSEANEVYCQYFDKYPPSRSCVSVGLPPGIEVALDVSFLQHSHAHLTEGKGKCPSGLRAVLLVQSLSHWAPLCIGPYAQCNSVQGLLVTVSGQIPLQPGSMQLRWNTPREGGGGGGATPTATATVMQRLRAQTVLCMRHVQRVLACSGDDGGVVEPGGYLHAALHVTVYLNYPLILLQMRQEGSSVLQEELVEHLKKLVQECVRYDLEIPGAGGSSRGRSGSNYSVFEAGSGYYRSYSVLSNSDDEDDDDDPAGERESSTATSHVVPVTVIGVRSIPKGALVEAEVLGSARGAIKCMQGGACSGPGVAVAAVDGGALVSHGVTRSALTEYIESWPVWQTPALRNGSTTVREEVSQPPKGQQVSERMVALPSVEVFSHGMEDLPYMLRSSWRGVRRGVCVGYATISSSSDNSAAHVLYSALYVLMREVKRCVTGKAALSMSALHHVRLYHHRLSPTLSEREGEEREEEAVLGEQLRALVPRVSKMLDLCSPIIVLPCLIGSSGGASDCQLLTAQYTAVDLVGWETVKWIRGANNINDSSGKG